MRPKPSAVGRARPDGRRQLLVYIQPTIIKDLKKAAIELERNAYEITEDALSDWLKMNKPGKRTRSS